MSRFWGSLRAVSKQWLVISLRKHLGNWGSFRAISEQFQSNFYLPFWFHWKINSQRCGTVFIHYFSGLLWASDQLQSSYRAVSERFPIISGQFQNRIKFLCLMNSGQFPSNSFGWCQCSFRSTPEQFSSRFRSISNRLQVNSRAVYEQLFKENFTQFSGPFQSNSRSILEHFTSNCRSVSEQFLKANFTQFSSPFQSNSKPTPEQFLSVFQWVSEQFQSNFQTIRSQFSPSVSKWIEKKTQPNQK